MAKKKIFEDVSEEDVLECYLDRETKMSPMQIAAELGVTIQSVRRICLRYNNQTKSERMRWIKKHGWTWYFRK